MPMASWRWQLTTFDVLGTLAMTAQPGWPHCHRPLSLYAQADRVCKSEAFWAIRQAEAGWGFQPQDSYTVHGDTWTVWLSAWSP